MESVGSTLAGGTQDIAALLPLIGTEQREKPVGSDRGYEYVLKSELIDTWSRWISVGMECLLEDGRLECWEALRDATSEKGKWELTELDCQLAWGWTRRELALLKLSMDLECVLQTRVNEYVSEAVDVRESERLRVLMNSEFQRVRRKRIDQEREAARKRMEGAMKDARERAENEGRPWQGDQDFLPMWTEAIEFVDKRWSLAISDPQDELKGAEDDLRGMWEESERRRQHGWDLYKDRNAALQQLRKRVSHERWHAQAQSQRQMMDTTFQAICDLPISSPREHFAEAYKFPKPDQYATAKFVYLHSSSSRGKACSAMVYDAWRCSKEVVCDVVARGATRSVVDVDRNIVASIPPNDHLLFLRIKGGEVEEPAFVRQNRERWPAQKTENSSMFFFTPHTADPFGQSCWVRPGETIAHVLVFLVAPCFLHVSLIHQADVDKTISVSLQTNYTGIELAKLSDISHTFRLHDFLPFALPEGRHELILVPRSTSENRVSYYLRDIVINLSPNINVESSLVQDAWPGISGIS